MLSVTPRAGELLFRVAPLGCQHRQAAQAFDAAQAGGALENLQPVEERARRGRSRRQDRRTPSRRIHASASPPARDPDALRAPGSRPGRTRLSFDNQRATAIALALCRSTRIASVFSPRPSAYAACGSSTVPSFLRASRMRAMCASLPARAPAGHVAVAVQVLRRAVHHEIDAEGDRLLVDRAGKGVVEHRDHLRWPCTRSPRRRYRCTAASD